MAQLRPHDGSDPKTWAGRLRTEIERCPFHSVLHIEAIGADEAAGEVTIGLANRPELSVATDSDILHGGVVATLVDVAAHAAIACALGRVAPTIDLRIDYLQAARGPRFTATARALRIGRSVARADVDVRDASGVLAAVGRGTFSTR